jgi:hypothetical protein
MKNKKINAVHVWKQMEDLVVPRLRLSVIERAVYSHLLRHSRLEGKAELRFSILWLARGACLSTSSVRQSVRSLAAKGALRLAERSRAGHVVKVRLPEEIRSGSRRRERTVRRRVCVQRERRRKDGLLGNAGAARGNPRTRGRVLLLLLAPGDADGAGRRSCGAACAGRRQRLPEPGVLVRGM